MKVRSIARPSRIAARIGGLRSGLVACVVVAAAVLTLGRPVLAADACPQLVSQAVVAVGQRIDVHGSFQDWANPGAVSITATRADGRTRAFEGAPDGDGTWDIHLRFGWEDVGRWRLRLDQWDPGLPSRTCIDSVRVRAPGVDAPDTATLPPVAPAGAQDSGLALLVALFAGLALRVAARPRRRAH